MSFKKGDYIIVINPDYDDKFKGDVAVVIGISKRYRHPYICKYLIDHKHGFESDIFADHEIQLISEDDAMVAVL